MTEQKRNLACCGFTAAAWCFGIRHTSCTVGNHGDVVWAPEVWVVVVDVDRIVLRIHVIGEVGEVGLTTCVCGRNQSDDQTPSSDWRGALEGNLDGEDASAGWLWMTRTQLYLEPLRSVCWREKVCCGTLQEVYSVYTHRRVQWVASDWTRKRNESRKNLDGGQRSRILSWTFSWSILLRFPWACLYFRNCFIDYFWSDHLSSCQLCFCHPFQVEDTPVWTPPGCRRPLRRWSWGWESAFICEVLLPMFAKPFQVLSSCRVGFVIQSPSVFRRNMYNIHFSSRLSLDLSYR